MGGEQKILSIDYNTCIGCETCEFVCRFVHDTPRIHMTRTRDGVMVPLYCHHCEDASCIKVCKRAALKRDASGAVVLHSMLCRGCETRHCIQACPFSAMLETDKGVMLAKCDLCSARRQIGLEPACAEMCPCGAISYLTREQAAAQETEESRSALKRVLDHIRQG